MSNLAKARFLKALRVHVLPLLRKEGLKGTYPTFRRAVAKQLVHVIQLQATQLGGGGVYVNLAAKRKG